MNAPPWTTRGVAILREHFPHGGPRAVWAALPDDQKRSFDAISCAARTFGVKRVGKPTYERFEATPAIDKALRAAAPMGEISARFGVSRDWLVARASALNVTYHPNTRRAWEPREIAILLASEGRGVAQVRWSLRKAGFNRGIAAINQQRAKLKISGRREFEGYFTLYELADLLGREAETVKRWTARRHDPLVFRREGQMYLFKHKEVRQWIARNPESMDFTRLPSTSYAWFIEFLTGISPSY